MIYIHEKDIFGKLFRGFSLDISEEIIDKDFLISNRINSLVVRRSVNQEKEDLTMLSEIPLLEGLSFPDTYYPTLNVLKHLSNILYLNIKGKVGEPIPFESLLRLWCVYLNYDKKTCSSIFKAQNLESIIIENAGEISSIDFLSHLPNLREVRFIGQISIKDNRIKHLLNNSNLQYFFIPVKKNYDITITDLRR